jgi:hypothetical protein
LGLDGLDDIAGEAERFLSRVSARASEWAAGCRRTNDRWNAPKFAWLGRQLKGLWHNTVNMWQVCNISDWRDLHPDAIATTVPLARPRSEEVASGESHLIEKLKHAKDFGCGDGTTAAQFKSTLKRFIDAKSTYRKAGTFRGDPVSLFYDRSTRLVVITKRDGTFVSGWGMTKQAFRHLLKTGNIGGGP